MRDLRRPPGGDETYHHLRGEKNTTHHPLAICPVGDDNTPSGRPHTTTVSIDAMLFYGNNFFLSIVC